MAIVWEQDADQSFNVDGPAELVAFQLGGSIAIAKPIALAAGHAVVIVDCSLYDYVATNIPGTRWANDIPHNPPVVIPVIPDAPAGILRALPLSEAATETKSGTLTGKAVYVIN